MSGNAIRKTSESGAGPGAHGDFAFWRVRITHHLPSVGNDQAEGLTKDPSTPVEMVHGTHPAGWNGSLLALTFGQISLYNEAVIYREDRVPCAGDTCKRSVQPEGCMPIELWVCAIAFVVRASTARTGPWPVRETSTSI